MKLWPFILVAAALLVALFVAPYLLGSHPGGERASVLDKTAWQRMAMPGKLSSAHAFLEHNCTACHTPVKGVEAANCIVCHANNESLLQRQPTAFHANIGNCQECHREHLGEDQPLTQMDHSMLSRIGLRKLQLSESGSAAIATDDESAQIGRELSAWIDYARDHSMVGNPHLRPGEAVLNCWNCHANDDKHFQFFGRDCSQCHATDRWTIAEYRHPSVTSVDCAQCHQAPPSHYMMHFQMISMKVARQPSAKVNQCYKCHQTTSWNDIKGVGWYKHH